MSLPKVPPFLPLLLVVCGLCAAGEPCSNRKFYHRPELNNTIFTESLLSANFDISRLDCISRCSRDASCQLITYNPPSRSCRLHSDSLTTGSEETGWLYYGIDCDHFVFPHGAGVLPGQFTLDSCVPGYVLVSPLSGGSCYHAGYWTAVDEGCVPFSDYIQVVPVGTLTNGTEIVLDAKVRDPKFSRIMFYNEHSSLFFRILFREVVLFTSHLNGDIITSLYKDYQIINRRDRAMVSIKIIGTQKLSVYFNATLFFEFQTSQEISLTSYIKFGTFEQIYSIRILKGQ